MNLHGSRSADNIKKICRRFKAHDKDIREKTALLDAVWIRIETQMRFLTKISHLLEDELAKSQLNLLHILEGKLIQAVTQLPVENLAHDMDERSSKHKIIDHLNKWKWAFKDSLSGLIVELEEWQSRFDPTWYLMILNSNKIMDNELQLANKRLAQESGNELKSSKDQFNPLTNIWKLRSASKPDYKPNLERDWATLKNPKELQIMFSMARAILLKDGSLAKLYIAEAVIPPDGSHGPINLSQIKVDVESLAGRLQQIDPATFGLLRCKCVIKHRAPITKAVTGMELIYGTLPNSDVPSSLRGLLLDSGLVPSVSSIVRIAKQLVRSISFLHTFSFVHKNIRPENILIFPSKNSLLGMSFLVGFNQFRHSKQQTNLLGDPAWHRNLYRHPERQGTNVINRYVMQHDIYSLGVCLLEIGLWQSFVHYPSLNPAAAPSPPVSSEIQISNADFEDVHRSLQLRMKERLVDMAKRRLPSRMGDVYIEVVLACLKCLDPGHTLGNEDRADKDGTFVGVTFIDQILAKIDGISV